MSKTILIAEIDSLTCRQGGGATANIKLMVNGHAFPSHDWNDFVVVIMEWWVRALTSLLRNTSMQETIHFMDGPYAIEVCTQQSGTLQFRALTGANRNVEVVIGEANMMSFSFELIKQSREILDACRKQVWWSQDAQNLESSLFELTKEYSRRLS